MHSRHTVSPSLRHHTHRQTGTHSCPCSRRSVHSGTHSQSSPSQASSRNTLSPALRHHRHRPKSTGMYLGSRCPSGADGALLTRALLRTRCTRVDTKRARLKMCTIPPLPPACSSPPAALPTGLPPVGYLHTVTRVDATTAVLMMRVHGDCPQPTPRLVPHASPGCADLVRLPGLSFAASHAERATERVPHPCWSGECRRRKESPPLPPLHKNARRHKRHRLLHPRPLGICPARIARTTLAPLAGYTCQPSKVWAPYYRRRKPCRLGRPGSC